MSTTTVKKKMNKSHIAIPVILVAAVVITALLIKPIRAVIAINGMKPLATGEVITDVFTVNNAFVNIYLYKSGGGYIMFDAGSDEKATKAALTELNISENDVSAIFLTHTDYDHVAAMPLFSSADVYMAASNVDFLQTREGKSRSKVFLDIGRTYSILTDGETVTVNGAEIQCIFTPGHTPGSVSYIVNGSLLFTGDNLSLKNGKATLFNDVFNMDNESQKQSLRKLAALVGIDYVFTMHMGYTDDFKTTFAEWSK